MPEAHYCSCYGCCCCCCHTALFVSCPKMFGQVYWIGFSHRPLLFTPDVLFVGHWIEWMCVCLFVCVCLRSRCQMFTIKYRQLQWLKILMAECPYARRTILYSTPRCYQSNLIHCSFMHVTILEWVRRWTVQHQQQRIKIKKK